MFMARCDLHGNKVVLVMTRLEAEAFASFAARLFPLPPKGVFEDRKERRAAWRAYRVLEEAVTDVKFIRSANSAPHRQA
jgi:hypothetical protein